MTKKINMFKADRELSARVADFMTYHVSRITDTTRHDKTISGFRKDIASYENLRGSAHVTTEQVDAMIADKVAEIEAENARYEKAREEKARWQWAQEDVELYKAINCREGVADAAVAWLNAWKLEADESTNIVRDIVDATKGRRKATARKIVNSGATTWTQDRTKADVLNVAYCVVAEYMIKAGTLKATQVPEDVQEWFAPKKKADK